MTAADGTRAGWVCPHCNTAYSPDVTECRCATVQPLLSERLKRARRDRIGLGGALIRFCNCPPCWGGLAPPPSCPVHGQAEMYQVRC